MRIGLIILIGIHGIIHIFGFLKSFGISEFEALSQPISKPYGTLWLIAFILFIITLVLLIGINDYWWVFGLVSVIVSQILIILFWQDAKFGTIPNLLILLACIIAYASFNLAQIISMERSLMFSEMESVEGGYATRQKLDKLPAPVQKWLNNIGFNESNIIHSVYLKQDVLMKLKPEQNGWYKADAEQYFTTRPPAFNWSVNLKMNPLIKIHGRDKFENGKGEMLIKILSILPVVDVKENAKINQGALQRYLAEMVWFPSVALSQYINWEDIDDNSAKATISYNGTSGSGTFYFNDDGEFIKFNAMRYKDIEETSELKEWVVDVKENKVINGIKIPVKVEVSWKLEAGKWTWLKLRITEIEYNIEKMPVDKNAFFMRSVQ